MPYAERHRYAVALNTLGELLICLGCGDHMPAGRSYRAYCSQRCRVRVSRRGGRRTRTEVREIIAAMPSAA